MTFEKYLQQDIGNYPLRDILDNLTDTQIEESVLDYCKKYSKEQVSKKKKSIIRIAKKYRRYESGIDKNGFIYISQLEAICR